MADDVKVLRNGRPKINRELVAAERRLAEINAGLLACYETIAVGNQKKAALERRIAELHESTNAD